MNAESQRIALAKWMGWTELKVEEGWKPAITKTHMVKPGEDLIASPPNYPASLDACAEAEAKLTDEQEMRYWCEELPSIVQGQTGWLHLDIPLIAGAKAAQRCEALCRALNLWTEE